MQLTGLEIDGFRNLRLLRLVPSPSFNVFIGDNGAGKTNLLEAIYFLGRLRSFRASRLEQLIQHGRAQAAVSATFQQDAMTSRVDLELTPQGRRVKVDGKGPGRIGDYCSRFQVVLFTPEDVELPRGAPRLRRQLLDRALFNHRPGYLAEAQRLAEVLQRRNAVLHGARGAVPRDLLEPYDRQLAEVGALVACRRRDLVAELGPAFQRILAQLLGVHEAGELRYRSTVPGVDEGADPETASQRYLARLTADRPRDLALRTTTTGPQRDDLLLTSAQSAFAVAMLLGLHLSIYEAAALVVLFLVQLVIPSTHTAITIIYLVLAAFFAFRNRSQIREAVRSLSRRPAAH